MLTNPLFLNPEVLLCKGHLSLSLFLLYPPILSFPRGNGPIDNPWSPSRSLLRRNSHSSYQDLRSRTRNHCIRQPLHITMGPGHLTIDMGWRWVPRMKPPSLSLSLLFVFPIDVLKNSARLNCPETEVMQMKEFRKFSLNRHFQRASITYVSPTQRLVPKSNAVAPKRTTDK